MVADDPTVHSSRTVTSGRARLTLAGGTCVGRRYPANFDVLHVDPVLPFVAVADGMGDGQGSAVAGRTTVDVLVAAVRGDGAAPAGLRPAATAPAGLRSAVAEAQARVGAAGERLGQLTGCTLTALVGDTAGTAWIVQIGDSRAYRLRADLLELLTVDHTMAWLGAVNGWWAADSPEAAMARYQLTRYVGHPERPEPDLLGVTLQPGDVYALCTDGVAEQVDYRRLRDLLGSGADPADIAARVLDDSLAAGGRDNATIAVVRVETAPARDGPDPA